MKKLKKIWGKFKRFMKDLEVKDRMSDGKISSAIIAFCCFVFIGIVMLYCWLFG